jgi:hypothetical protein
MSLIAKGSHIKSYVEPSRIRIGLCLLFIGLCAPSSMGQQQGSVSQSTGSGTGSERETYVSEVIIQAPWAEKCLYQYGGGEESPPGEFGHYVSEETELGPNSFTVAPNGDIYVSDPLNKRLQRFGPNGQLLSVIPVMAGLICVDGANNIYTSRAGNPMWFIDKFDQTGNLLESYPIDIYRRRTFDGGTESRGLDGIYCDNSGNVFIAFHYELMKLDKTAGSFSDTSWGGLCQVGDAARVFSLDEQNSNMIKDGFWGANSSAVDQAYFVGNPAKLHLISFKGETLRTINSTQGSFIGQDKDGSIYTQQLNLAIYGDEDRETKAPLVRKYNVRGEQVASFKYWCEKPYFGSLTYLDLNGNLYLLCQSLGDGLRVIKWHKVD